ncbi:hypothetical protein JX266_002240 [Neoarthrinium moseri]|nr:hypothetical protein JX266_002240 [Neoarthrinium moseri]
MDLTDLFNNRGFAMSPGDADFDGLHSGYPAQYLPSANFTYSGVNYIFPQYAESGNDNVLAQGQKLSPPKGRYFSVHLLAAAETAIATGFVNATYTDGSTTSGPVLVDPFWNWPYPYGGDVIFPYHFKNDTIDYNRSMIFQTINWLDSTKELESLQLPNVTTGDANGPGGATEETRLHIFAVSLVPAAGSGISLDVQYARSTKTWFEGTNKTQIVEVLVNNAGDEWVLANNSVKVTVSASGLQTVNPGTINRLRPGDQAQVKVGVVNTDGTAPGTSGTATVHIEGNGVNTSYSFNATYGIASYEPTFESIYSHESSPWFKVSFFHKSKTENDAKYGIFIHWGPYAVPGWGNAGKNEGYAEWYWWQMVKFPDPQSWLVVITICVESCADFMFLPGQNQGPNTSVGTYEYHLETYGENIVYDDFIQNFTASAYDPKEWVDLFADAGAQYFVSVSKHHDGYAIFDLPENVTKRTSVAQYPHKDLLQMLFDAADQHQPHLHKATYYSLPEWFNPDYAPYGFGSWPGGNATNPYTNETLPYTGHVPVDDYVTDVLLPQMLTLADMGTEIMWCDIGGPNLTAEFAAHYFNSMAEQGKQVLLDNRCGVPGDFDTPEYARYEAVQIRKWESSLGMDPFSYGYNRATPDSAYITPSGIVTSLMDIISKNGNFLLDIGPTANGTIIAIEQENLRAAGKWIQSHAEAIFNTTYWFITPEEGSTVRFTQNADAFYITTLYAPNSTLVLNSPVPYVAGDNVVVVGGSKAGTVVPSQLLSNGSLQLTISEEVRDADEYSWVFKIPFGSASKSESGGTGPPPSSSGGSRTVKSTDSASLISLLTVSLAITAWACV